MRFRFPALIGLLLVASAAAQAQNLVANPGFETGDFTEWTSDGGSVDSGVGHSGNFAASFGAVSPNLDVLSQTLLTQAGQQYTLSLFAQTPEAGGEGGSGSPNSLAVFFGGNLIDGPFTVPDNADYEEFVYTVTATSAATELRFEISNNPDFTQLDDVSVTAVASSSTPEPGALALVVIGLAGGQLVRRSRRKAAHRATASVSRPD